MTIKSYTIARMTDFGPEPIGGEPMTLRQARLMRVRMVRMLRGNKYVVLNLPTWLGYEEEFKLP